MLKIGVKSFYWLEYIKVKSMNKIFDFVWWLSFDLYMELILKDNKENVWKFCEKFNFIYWD